MTPHAARWLCAGALAGFLGVAMGAFGAHALRDVVDARAMQLWQTAAHYQHIHALVLVAIAALGATRWTKALGIAAWSTAFGMIIFSGTLGAMALGGPRVLGAITPLGGLSLLAGWLGLFAAGVQRIRTA